MAWAYDLRSRGLAERLQRSPRRSQERGAILVSCIDDHDRGLDHDLPRLISRGAAPSACCSAAPAAAVLAACGGRPRPDRRRATGDRRRDGGEIPEETAGPFPGDGSNGPNVLTESGVVRQDITKSFGDASGVAEGVPDDGRR